jgi:group II intron reverse transcriptase/maturase
VDADITRFFDTLDHEWVPKFVAHRVADPRILRLLRMWLRAGVSEDGVWSRTTVGTPQGAVISPLLANIYLPYVLDLWVKWWRGRSATGETIIVRYADDFVVGFQRKADAEQFLHDLRDRLGKFTLALHPEKTRLIEFGRFAQANRADRGEGKPETFNFLGFTHICGRSRRGKFLLHRRTRRDRMRTKLKEIKEELRRRMHQPIPEQGKWLRQVVTGYFAYHAVPTNGRALQAFRAHVTDLWRRTLKRRSQRDRNTWERITKLADDWLPRPRILHPWPNQRFAVKYPRWEPDALIGPVRICAGGAQQ